LALSLNTESISNAQRPSARLKLPKTIFAIDDDPLMLEILAQVLSPPAYNLIGVHSGQGGLDSVFRTPPDLVLLDLGLPDLPGMSVLKALKGRSGWSKVPIVMLTADDAIEPIVRARELGARGYLCKPISAVGFAGVVADLLASPDVVWLDDLTRLRRARASDRVGSPHPHGG
jgi:CheY-like chemotaxis protein